jgi:hypothetical protein
VRIAHHGGPAARRAGLEFVEKVVTSTMVALLDGAEREHARPASRPAASLVEQALPSSAPQCPVTLADRHVAAPIGVLAILTGQVLSGEDSPHDPAAQRPPGAIGATPSRPARQPLAGARIGRLPARGSMRGRHGGATPRATALAKPRRACRGSGRAASGRAVRRGYLMPTTIDSGPARCSTQVWRKPACRSHCWHCAPV